MSANPQDVAKVLREFGQAIRGDWGTIDGRSIRGGMDSVAERIESDCDPAIFLDHARDDLGVCPAGKGHWTEYCNEPYVGCKGGDAK